MVFASLGVFVEEDELRNRAYTTLWGTSAMDAARCARHYGFQVQVAQGGVQTLRLVDRRIVSDFCDSPHFVRKTCNCD